MLGVLGVFTSCHEDAPTVSGAITITVTNDFTEIVEAINNGAIKQEEAIAQLIQAIDKMNDDNKVKMQALMDILTSQTNKLEAKLALIEAVIGIQTLKLQEKYDLLIKAVEKNTLKIDQLSTKLAACIDNINGTLSDRLKDIRDLLEESNDDIIDKLILIEAAMKAQSISFEEKMNLLNEAIKNNTLKIEEKGDLIAKAIDAVNGTMDEKLGSIFSVLDTLGTVHAEKLDLIEGAMKAQTLAFNKKMKVLISTIKNMADYSAQLEAIETAIKNLPNYSDKLDAISAAIAALPDYTDKIGAIETALKNILTQMGTDATTQGEIKTQIENLVTAINNLKTEVTTGNTDEKTALADIIAKLEALKGSIGGGSGSGEKELFEGVTKNGTTMTVVVGKITGSAWIDLNENGTKDAGEDLISGSNSCLVTSSSGKFTIHGSIDALSIYDANIKSFSVVSSTLQSLYLARNILTSLDLNCPNLENLHVHKNQLASLDLSKCPKLSKDLFIFDNQISGVNMDALINSLPTLSTATTFRVRDTDANGEQNRMTPAQAAAAKAKGWIPELVSSTGWSEYTGETSAFTKSNYYQWDALTPINGVNPNYNTITTGVATNSCVNAPTADEMGIYLGNGAYYDNGAPGTNQQSYTVDGTTYHTGLWLRKKTRLNNSKSSWKVTPTTGRPPISKINDYFFLPACGSYNATGTLEYAGVVGRYWSSSPTPGYPKEAYYLIFSEGTAEVVRYKERNYGFLPMVGFDPTYISGGGSITPGTFIFTKSKYYQWDAIDPINGTYPEYNDITTGSATNSCKYSPNDVTIEAYLGNGVYWDNGDASTNQQYYMVDGNYYHAGLWVKKQKYLDYSKRKSSVTPTAGRPKDSEIDKYFFLPACGDYDKGSSSSNADSKGYYWLGSIWKTSSTGATILYFDSNSASMMGFNRGSAFVPIAGYDPTYTK